MKALHETLSGAKELIAGSGFQVSASCWEDERTIYASSVESVPGTYGHPRAEVIYHKDRGTVQVIGLSGAAKYFHDHDVFCGDNCFFRKITR